MIHSSLGRFIWEIEAMSRIGKQPINLPAGVKVALVGGEVVVEGPKAKLEMRLPPLVGMAVEGDVVTMTRENDGKRARAMHGLARSLVAGMVVGVTDGFQKKLEIIGVGYRAQSSGNKLTMNLGYSHPIEYSVPDGVTVTVENNTQITVQGADKQLVGEVAATIRRFRKPEPYKGKGVRYQGEHIIMKEGKTVG